MGNHILVGFGFGPIQSGLFVPEAFKSGKFSRIVIAEVDQGLVDAVSRNNGSYHVNVAARDGITRENVDGIEILNPTLDADRAELVKALMQASEIVTALPSVDVYDCGEHSVAALIRLGIENTNAPARVIYTAENNNHAAEMLEERVGSHANVQYLNTVIGKMSQVLSDRREIVDKRLQTIAPGIDRAFLVEEFNRILVTQCSIPGFTPGIGVFLEKEDLIPFEEAKLFGHNAIHALLAYLGAAKGYARMAQLKNDAHLMQIARNAFIHESGEALIRKYAGLHDELFTHSGFERYADDLLGRMTNPYLDDPIERAARDPRRKLGFNDRIFGTIQLCLEQGIEPVNMAKGAVAGLGYLRGGPIGAKDVAPMLQALWRSEDGELKSRIIRMVQKAMLA